VTGLALRKSSKASYLDLRAKDEDGLQEELWTEILVFCGLVLGVFWGGFLVFVFVGAFFVGVFLWD